MVVDSTEDRLKRLELRVTLIEGYIDRVTGILDKLSNIASANTRSIQGLTQVLEHQIKRWWK